MNGDLSRWSDGLLFSALSVVLGIVGLVSARRDSERWWASGLMLQGILLTFVVGGAFVRGSTDLKLGGLTIVVLLIVHSVWGPGLASATEPTDKDDPS